MKKLILTTTLLALAAAPALAADASATTASTTAPSWTGFYIGVHGGGAKQSLNHSFNDPNGVIKPVSVSGDPIWGAVGGIQLGYNWQFHPNFAAGIEGDLSGAPASRNNASSRMSFLGGPVNNTTFKSSTRLDWLSSVRPKLGVIGWRKIMFFATGGVAWAHIRYSASESHIPPTFAVSFASRANIDPILCGWVAGGGVESQVADHILLRLEYLGYSIPAASASANLVPNPGAFPTAFNYGWSRDNIAVIRAAASYKF